MGCGALCVEATGDSGQPTGVWRDLLSAWWLPVALLLPPLYALVAPAAARPADLHPGAPRLALPAGFSALAALGLAGACASVLFRPARAGAGRAGRAVADLPGPKPG